MITPAYAVTATERVLPKLALDFTTGVLDPRVTVTRALNTATRVNASGYIEAVNANLPRFDYAPTTLAPRGLLIEETRQNLMLYSEQFDNAYWTKFNATVDADVAVSPANIQNADKIVENTANSQHAVVIASASRPTLASGLHAASVFVKAAGRDYVALYNNGTSGGAGILVDLTAGTVITTVGTQYSSSSVQAFRDGWFRIVLIFNSLGGTSGPTIYVTKNSSGGAAGEIYAGDGTSGLYVYGGQLEAGAFATSYIPTTTTSLTRNADIVTMTGTNFSSWFNGSEGAFMAQWLQGPVSTTKVGGVLECVGSVRSPQTTSGVVFYGQNGGSVLLGASTANALYKVAYAYKTGTVERVAINGGATASNSVNYSTVPTSLTIGHLASATNFWVNSWIQKLSYWPQSLTSSEVRAFSK